MDSYDKILENPIVGIENESLDSCPDLFRSHPFNREDISNGKWLGYSLKDCANLTGTNLGLWENHEKRLKRITELLIEFSSEVKFDFLSDIFRPDFNLGADQIETRSKAVVLLNEIYDLLDMQIVKTMLDPNDYGKNWSKLFLPSLYDKIENRFPVLDRLSNPSFVVAIRASMYVIWYKIKITHSRRRPSTEAAAKSVYNKALELQSDPRVRDFFFKEEVVGYRDYALRVLADLNINFRINI